MDTPDFRPLLPCCPVIWRVEPGLVDYQSAVSFMESQVEEILSGHAPETVWLVEHAPLYTAGTSAKEEHLLRKDLFPVFLAGRGGDYTYHGPGQRVVYIMLDLKRRKKDVHAFVRALQSWIISALLSCGIGAKQHENRVGVWVARKDLPLYGAKDLPLYGAMESYQEDKIAAIGIKIRQWVSFHGIAINIHPDLEHFEGIVPCGLSNYGVTSFRDLGKHMKINEFDDILRDSFTPIFGETALFEAGL